MSAVQGLLLAFGTLSIVPVPAPSRVDRSVGGWAMAWAPWVGLVLGALTALPLLLPGPPLLTAALAVTALAVLTRAMHLDGLADTADGLGSRAPAARALAIMKQSDIGPFGVVALVLALLVEVAAVGSLTPWTLAAAVVVSRGTLPLVCLPWLPAARRDGLGVVVAGSVRWWHLLIAAPPVLVAAWWAPWTLVGPLAGVALTAHCRRRLGGGTGDVYGATVEVAFAAALVAAAIAG